MRQPITSFRDSLFPVFWALLLVATIFGGAAAAEKAADCQFTFAMMADVQYADKARVGNRFYRQGIETIEKAAAELNPRKPDFVIHLGDIIDGQKTLEKTQDDLRQILTAFDAFDSKVHHVVGNHCRNAGQPLLEMLGLKRAYYDFTPAAGWRMIVLDGTDAGYGVLGKEQLVWLAEALDRAQKRGEKVLVFCHFALLKGAAAHHRMKEPEPVLALLDRHPEVIAYFAGHDHAGGYTVRNRVYHWTLHGMVDYPEPLTYAMIEVFADRLEVTGHGAIPTRTLSFQ